MSIATKTGDHGTTGLMYNRRVSKGHPLVEAGGSVDELNAALGPTRATAEDDWVRENILAVQKDLILLMGELATLPDDLPRYFADGFSRITPELTAKLDDLVQNIERQNISFRKG